MADDEEHYIEISVEELWRQFEKQTIPETASGAQRREMKRSFYAGADAFMEIMSAINSIEEITDEQAMALYDAVEGEINAFNQSISESEPEEESKPQQEISKELH